MLLFFKKIYCRVNYIDYHIEQIYLFTCNAIEKILYVEHGYITMFFISECGCYSYGFGICNKANFSNSSSQIYNKKSKSIQSICNLLYESKVNDIDKSFVMYECKKRNFAGFCMANFILLMVVLEIYGGVNIRFINFSNILFIYERLTRRSCTHLYHQFMEAISRHFLCVAIGTLSVEKHALIKPHKMVANINLPYREYKWDVRKSTLV